MIDCDLYSKTSIKTTFDRFFFDELTIFDPFDFYNLLPVNKVHI